MTEKEYVPQPVVHHWWSWKGPQASNNIRPPLSSQFSLTHPPANNSSVHCKLNLSVDRVSSSVSLCVSLCVKYLSAASIGGFGLGSSVRLTALILAGCGVWWDLDSLRWGTSVETHNTLSGFTAPESSCTYLLFTCSTPVIPDSVIPHLIVTLSFLYLSLLHLVTCVLKRD